MKSSHVVTAVLLAALASGCEENTAVPKSNTLLSPQNVRALAVDGSSVSLKWDAPSALDSTYVGFVVQYGTVKDLLPTSATTYLATGLPSGVTDFSLSSIDRDTTSSAVALLGWAPASRFDQGYVLEEYSIRTPPAHCGLNIGGTVDCEAVALDASKLEGVVLSEHQLYTCSEPGQEKIKRDIAEHDPGGETPC